MLLFKVCYFLKYVTLKMVFLVTFATAQRRSELHALSYENISFNKEVQLAPVPCFMAKNQAPNTSRLFSLPCQ
jgi:hypothetical protein